MAPTAVDACHHHVLLHCSRLPAGEPPASPTATGDDAASWHLESVEVATHGQGAPRPAYFACRKWLDARSGYRAELPASSRDPRLEEVEYKVCVCVCVCVSRAHRSPSRLCACVCVCVWGWGGVGGRLMAALGPSCLLDGREARVGSGLFSWPAALTI